jgi:hypothetical protein
MSFFVLVVVLVEWLLGDVAGGGSSRVRFLWEFRWRWTDVAVGSDVLLLHHAVAPRVGRLQLGERVGLGAVLVGIFQLQGMLLVRDGVGSSQICGKDLDAVFDVSAAA